MKICLYLFQPLNTDKQVLREEHLSELALRKFKHTDRPTNQQTYQPTDQQVYVTRVYL